MANLTEAERLTHYWAKQTATAISWTGGLNFLIALFTFSFTIWTFFSKNGEEKRRREGADALDRDRRRKNDAIDEERRRRGEEEEKKRREKKEKEEAERREKREEAGREAEEEKTKALERLEGIIKGFRYVRFSG